MLLSQKFPCDQTAVLQPYVIQRTARLERDDFDWQVCVRIQCHCEWKPLQCSDKRTFNLRPTFVFIRYVFMHPGSTPAIWTESGNVDSVSFNCWKSRLVKKCAKVAPSATLKSKPLYFIYPLGFYFEAVVSLKVFDDVFTGARTRQPVTHMGSQQ